VDLPAQDEALGAYGRVSGNLADWVADAGDKAGDLLAVLAAEAAPPLGRIVRDGLQGAERGFGGVPGADNNLGPLDALLTDVYAGPGYEPLGLPLRPSAERAGKIRGKVAAPSPSACPAGCLDNLVHPLVTEVQGCAEFAQRCAAQVQAAHRPVKLSFGDVGSVVCLDEVFLRQPGRREQLLVHVVYCI